MSKAWKFHDYLAYQLTRIAFVKGGKFNTSDVRERLVDTTYLDKLYSKEFPTLSWNWDSFNDRYNRHIYKAVKSLGGARQKIRNRWVYSVKPELFINGFKKNKKYEPTARRLLTREHIDAFVLGN